MTASCARFDCEHSVEQHHAAVGPSGEVTVPGSTDVEIGLELLEDVLETAWERVHVRRDRECQPDRMAWARIGVLAHDEDPHRVHGLGECPQDLLTGRQVSAAGLPFRMKEGSQGRYLCGDWGEGTGP